MKAITLTRRVTIAIVAVSVVATLVSAALLANFIVPNSVIITSKPTLTAFDTNGAQLTRIDWGDLQQGTSGQFQFTLKNTGGVSTATQYIIDSGTCSTVNGGPCASVTSLNPTGLPSGTTLTWNLDQLQTAGGQPFTCTVNTATYNHCLSIDPGSGTAVITLTLSISNSAVASTTPYSFTIEFDSYSTPLG